jgi:hypothetical protein
MSAVPVASRPAALALAPEGSDGTAQFMNGRGLY